MILKIIRFSFFLFSYDLKNHTTFLPKYTNIKDAHALPEVSSLLRRFKGHCFYPHKASWTLSDAATSKPRVAMLI